MHSHHGPMQLGTLTWAPALERLDLVAAPVADFLTTWDNPRKGEIRVAEIDPAYADTEAMTEHYELDLSLSANCVLVLGKRGESETPAAVVVRATRRADINGVVRKHLGVRKASFLPMETAVADSSMEYGGITPIGLPQHYRLLVDRRVTDDGWAILGSGIRGSKIVLPGELLAELPRVEVLELGLG